MAVTQRQGLSTNQEDEVPYSQGPSYLDPSSSQVTDPVIEPVTEKAYEANHGSSFRPNNPTHRQARVGSAALGSGGEL